MLFYFASPNLYSALWNKHKCFQSPIINITVFFLLSIITISLLYLSNDLTIVNCRMGGTERGQCELLGTFGDIAVAGGKPKLALDTGQMADTFKVVKV